jgi:thiol-disulfide isomerase/thioredoxin
MKRIILLISFLFAVIILSAQEVKIDLKFENLKNNEVILGHHLSSQLVPDDTIRLDAKGNGSLIMDEKYPGGMYFLFLPNKTYFDFILDTDQQFTIIGDTTDFIHTVSFKGSEENTVFQDYQKKFRLASSEQQSLYEEREANKGNKEKIKEIDQKIENLTIKMEALFDEVIETYPDLFFTKFLKATRRVEVPKTITNKKEQYYYFRNHFFDNFDISDARLLRTPIYEGTIDMYIDKVVMQHPDTLIFEVDKLIQKSRSDDELFRFMMVHLHNKYASSQIMAHENVYVHLADKYYIPEASWSDPQFISDLKNKIKNRKKCLIGNKALDIQFRFIPSDSLLINELILAHDKMKADGMKINESEADSSVKIQLQIELLKEFFYTFEETGSLYESDAEFTILWFWTPDCSHCKKETPVFYEKYIELNLKEKNVEVISIFMQKDIIEWKEFCKNNDDWMKFLKKHSFSEWKNVWNPFDLFRRNYDITSSPVLYLLDKDKTIIAKKIGYEQALEILEQELKNE